MSNEAGSPTRPWYLTGASGWFGRTALWEYEQLYGAEALRRDVVAFASCDREIDFGSPHGPMQAKAMSTLLEQPTEPSGLLHLAFLTRDRIDSVGLQHYVAANRAITATVEHLLRHNPHLPIITTSSGAAAALDGKPAELESNPYATLKQEEEALWRNSAQQRMAVVFRVYAASGRFLKSPQIFALGDFVAKALAGEAIQITSRRPVIRSYVHVGTLMRLCWLMLRQPLPAGFQRLDACTDTLSLVDLAEQISEIWQLPAPQYELDPKLEPDNYQADVEPFRELLQRYGLISPSLAEQIQETALAIR